MACDKFPLSLLINLGHGSGSEGDYLNSGLSNGLINDFVNFYLSNGVRHFYFFVPDEDACRLRESLVTTSDTLYSFFSYPSSKVVKEAIWKALGLVISAESDWLLVCRGNEYIYTRSGDLLDIELKKYTEASQVIFPLLKFSRYENGVNCSNSVVEKFKTRFPYKYSTKDILGYDKHDNYTSFLHIGTGNVELGLKHHIVRGQIVNLINCGESYARWIGGQTSKEDDGLSEAIMGNVYDFSELLFKNQVDESMKSMTENFDLRQLVKMAKSVSEDEPGPIRDSRIVGRAVQ